MQHRARCRWPSSGRTNKTVTAPTHAPRCRQEAPGDTPGCPRVQRLQPGGLDPISSPRKLPLLLLLKTDLITDQRREDSSTRHASTQHFNDGPSRQGHRGTCPMASAPAGRPAVLSKHLQMRKRSLAETVHRAPCSCPPATSRSHGSTRSNAGSGRPAAWAGAPGDPALPGLLCLSAQQGA